jgi:hypothetical protein
MKRLQNRRLLLKQKNYRFIGAVALFTAGYLCTKNYCRPKQLEADEMFVAQQNN